MPLNSSGSTRPLATRPLHFPLLADDTKQIPYEDKSFIR